MKSDTKPKRLNKKYYGDNVNDCGNHIRGFENIPVVIKKKEKKEDED